jgi:hypothetical protein
MLTCFNEFQILISFKSATIQTLYNFSSAEATSGRLLLMLMWKQVLKKITLIPMDKGRKNGCTTFWVVMARSLIEVYWCFGGLDCLHLQGQRVNQARNQKYGELSSNYMALYPKKHTVQILIFWIDTV